MASSGNDSDAFGIYVLPSNDISNVHIYLFLCILEYFTFRDVLMFVYFFSMYLFVFTSSSVN